MTSRDLRRDLASTRSDPTSHSVVWVFGLLLAAIALGASNGAAAIGIGLGGIDRRTRLQVGIVFGAFEAGMPLVGLVLGREIASVLGGSAQQLGGALVVAIGVHEWFSQRGEGARVGSAIGHPARLVVTAFALSIDNLVVGFALGALHVSFLVAAATIGGVERGAHAGRPRDRHPPRRSARTWEPSHRGGRLDPPRRRPGGRLAVARTTVGSRRGRCPGAPAGVVCVLGQAIGVRSVPIDSISTSTVSPAWSRRGGVRRNPTPSGVPVASTSPGRRVRHPEA